MLRKLFGRRQPAMLDLVLPAEPREVEELLTDIDTLTSLAATCATNGDWAGMYKARHQANLLNDKIDEARTSAKKEDG